ncbi:transposase [Kribbella sp. NPDC003557]|uniref:RNA-guided endonuclease InsQ/TnpB family protein n=1 Tax=Kribbella sp. NPDC003557 TaxID=3154449 RepID=UPI0033A7FD43
MSRFRMYPTRAEQAGLLEQSRHARYVWNLALEQWSMWTRDKGPAAGFVEQCRQLTEARATFGWLRAGSQTVQQQALRDFDQAVKNFHARTHQRPVWRKAGQHDGFRVEVVGVDRGVVVSAALSTGELLACPGLSLRERSRLNQLERKLARCRRGSRRRRKVATAIGKLHARAADRRKDWVEKTSTELARRYDVIRVEDLRIPQMTRRPKPRPDPARPGHYLPNRRRAKAGLNRGILSNGWGDLVRRLEQKAPGRVERVSPANTSQTCSVCGHAAPESRKSQAVFRCVACGHEANADVNAAVNIAAGRAVSARRETPVQVSPKREPQLATSA